MLLWHARSCDRSALGETNHEEERPSLAEQYLEMDVEEGVMPSEVGTMGVSSGPSRHEGGLDLKGFEGNIFFKPGTQTAPRCKKPLFGKILGKLRNPNELFVIHARFSNENKAYLKITT